MKGLGVRDRLQSKLITYLNYAYSKTLRNNGKWSDSLAPSIKKTYTLATLQNKFDFSVFDQFLDLASCNKKYFQHALAPLVVE